MIKKKKIIISIAILVGILLSFIGGQVYSKYVARVKGEGIAQVATWQFNVNGQEEQVQTIKLQSTSNNQTLVNNKIAPGTSGKFDIIIDATGSDVGINYQVDFRNEQNKPTNLKFSYNGTEYNSITQLTQVLSGTINSNEEEKRKTFSIEWNWKYETGNTPEEITENDKIDTKDAENISNYEFDIIVSGTQVARN